MKKKVIHRCLLGAPLGLALSCAITIAISCTVGDGIYYAVVPALAEDCGSELNAVLLQALCSLLYGAAWAGASAIWEREDWSLLGQTAAHLAVCSLATFPTAWCLRWMDRTAAGILGYFGLFFAIYAVIWLVQYAAMRRKVAALNAGVRADRPPAG